MKIAYIVDSSTKLSSKLKDVYQVPFYLYDESGALNKSFNNHSINHYIETYQKNSKSYIEPTPGLYRDLYKKLLLQGFNHIIVIPNNIENSSSYTNARFAARHMNEQVTVLDSNTFEYSIYDVLYSLQNNSSIHNEMESIKRFDLETLLELIKTALKSLNLAIN